MKRKFHYLLVSSLLLSSCYSYKSTFRDSKVAKSNDMSIVVHPVVIEQDIDLTKKVQSTITGEIKGEHNIEYYKQLVLGNAIAEAKCDALFEPRFTYHRTVEKFANKITYRIEMEVTGYPIYFKNPRNFIPSDTLTMNYFPINKPVTVVVKSENSTPLPFIPKKNKNEGRIY